MLDPSACTSDPFLTLGAWGNAARCVRTFNTFLLHFKLPDGLLPADLDGVSIDLFVAEQKNTGVVMRIDGLGIRGATEAQALAAQSPQDYYVGSTDPAEGVTQIDAGAMLEGYGQQKPVNYRSNALTDYVREMLLAGGAGKQIVFRLSASEDYGCAADKCGGCQLKRYRFTRLPTKLTISARFAAMAAPDAVPDAEGLPSDPYALTELLSDELAAMNALDGEVGPQPWLASQVGMGVVVGASLVGVSFVCLAAAQALRRRHLRNRGGDGTRASSAPVLKRIQVPAGSLRESTASCASISPVASPASSPAGQRPPSMRFSSTTPPGLIPPTPRVDDEEISLQLGGNLHHTV